MSKNIGHRAADNLDRGFFGRLFTSYDKLDGMWRGGAIYGLFSRMCKSRASGFFGRFVSRSIEDSFIVRLVCRFANVLPWLTLRTYGTFLFSFGFYTSIIYAIRAIATTLTADTDALVSGIAVMILSLPLLFSEKTLAAAVTSSRFASYLAFDILGYRREEAYVRGRVHRRGDLAFLFGMFAGLSSFYFSAMSIIGLLAALTAFYVVMSKPETGVILIFLLFPFLPDSYMSALIIIDAVSYIIKLVCGRRTMRLDAADTLVFILFLLVFFSLLINYGAGTEHTANFRRVVFMAVYFLTSNLITNSAWRSRLIRALMFGGSSVAVISIGSLFTEEITSSAVGVSSAYISGMVLLFRAITESAEVSSYYLVMMIPVMIAYLMRRGTGSKRLNMLFFSSLTLIAVVFTMSRGIWLGALVGVVLMLMVYDLRFLWLPVAAAAGGPLVVMLLPEKARLWVTSMLDTSGYLTQGRVEVRQISAGIFFDNFLGGIGGGEGVFYSVYDASSSVGASSGNSQSLFLQIAVELGVFGLLVFVSAMVFLLIKAFSGCRYGVDRVKGRCSGALASGLLAALFCGISNYIWVDERMFMLFWMFAGALSAYNTGASVRGDEVLTGVVTGDEGTAAVDIGYWEAV